ncbi:MAG: VWA domain-containing protein [Jatrophihabitantaceae bacterium]
MVAVAAAVAAVLLVHRSSGGQHDASAGRSGCRIGLPLQVIVDPTIAPAVHTIVHAWERGRPAVDGLCINVSMAIQDSSAAEQALITSTDTTLWIPNSSVWPARLLSDAPKLAKQVSTVRSVASSPLVLATTPGHARALATAAAGGWTAGLGGNSAVDLPDPTSTAEGSLALLALQGGAGGQTASADTLASAYVRLGTHTLSGVEEGLQALRASPASAPAVVASEQQALSAEKQAAPGQLAAVYPHGPAPALDFPLVSIGDSPSTDYRQAVRDLAAALTARAAKPTLAKAGLRDAAGTPLSNATQPLGTQAVQLAPAPTTDTVTASIRLWASARTSQQLLTVIDVSGSMNDNAGNGQSKIQLASQACVAAMTFVPDGWSAGLWSFSRQASPADDWTELVPVGPVSSDRADLLDAARSLPTRVGGDTGLYDTALAAFERARDNYRSGRVNSVVLLTDGANLDPGGISLSSLLGTLKAEYSSTSPVHIVTIALGKDADAASLRQISAATGSVTHVVRDPTDVRTVLLRSVLRQS